MTEQEAIIKLEVLATSMMGGIQNGDKTVEATYDALDLAIAALKKQVPMKPKMIADTEDEWIYCPACNKQVGTSCWIPRFCYDCGQEIGE